MSDFKSPGVYVIEQSSGVKPIAGVSTSTGAFVGFTERGDIGQAKYITSFNQYEREFGGFIDNGALPFAVYQFFQEGGARCYVTRIGNDSLSIAETEVPADGGDIHRITAKQGGEWGNALRITIDNGSTADTFKISVKQVSGTEDEEEVLTELEAFDNLTGENVESIVAGGSKYIIFDWNDDAGDPVITITGDGSIDDPFVDTPLILEGGEGFTISDVTHSHFIGSEVDGTGLHSFDNVDDINIVVIPDAALASKVQKDDDILINVTNLAMNYCKLRWDCFYVADSPFGKTPSEVKTYKSTAKISSDFGALYYPWIKMSHPVTGFKLDLPPSGAIAGIYANTDIKIGVHKAPAGLATGRMKSISSIERVITKGEHDLLNPVGINVIRRLDPGYIVWGARTTTSDMEWKYINIRRLFLFVEESIDEGTQWVVFEPNTPELWGKVNKGITAFLTTVWRSGALFGNTADEAFYVKVDAENNPSEERDLGRLNIEIGIAPVKPAEFVIIKISQKTAAY